MKNSLIIVIFFIIYSWFVINVHPSVQNYSDIIVAATFFFTIFSGFFITRQNDRYSKIAEEISTGDGWFSYLYRVSGLVPRVQTEVREIIRDHYKKILESNNWAYHLMNPSTTLTRLTKVFSSLTEEENKNASTYTAWPYSFEVISNLQLTRKKMLMLYHQKLLPLQWAIIGGLGILVAISFNFVPSASGLIDVLKVIFGMSVVMVILLLNQLDSLTLFGKNFNKETVEDIFRILDEKDALELKQK